MLSAEPRGRRLPRPRPPPSRPRLRGGRRAPSSIRTLSRRRGLAVPRPRGARCCATCPRRSRSTSRRPLTSPTSSSPRPGRDRRLSRSRACMCAAPRELQRRTSRHRTRRGPLARDLPAVLGAGARDARRGGRTSASSSDPSDDDELSYPIEHYFVDLAPLVHDAILLGPAPRAAVSPGLRRALSLLRDRPQRGDLRLPGAHSIPGGLHWTDSNLRTPSPRDPRE